MLAGNQALTRAALETHHQISLARSMSAKRPMRARAAVVEHHELRGGTADSAMSHAQST